MKRRFFLISLIAFACGCAGQVREDDLGALARTPHGIDIHLEIAAEGAEGKPFRINGELLEVRNDALLVQLHDHGVERPVSLVLAYVNGIKKIALGAASMATMPRSATKTQKLLDDMRVLARFPQGLSLSLLGKLQAELDVVRIEELGK